MENNSNKNEFSQKEKREQAYNYILTKKYGDTITNEELNNILQEDLKDEYGKIRFRSQMNKVKDRLYKKGFVIRSIYNIGYYILKPNQVSSYTYRNFIVRPTNQYKKAKTILENLNNKNFNNFENLEFESTKSLNKKIIKTTNDLLNSNEYKNLAKNIKQNYGGNNGRK